MGSNINYKHVKNKVRIEKLIGQINKKEYYETICITQIKLQDCFSSRFEKKR
jgi:hypothetical protein